VDPVVALVRIIYLLDRAQAPGHKVAAFRRALDVYAEHGPAVIADLASRGALEQLPGIGSSTAGVITDALAGRTPRYLADLEVTSVLDPGPGGTVRDALRGDLHCHTTWSDGGWPLEAMARSARALGHEYLVITDHSARLTVAHGLSRERLEQQLRAVAETDVAPLDLLSGIEVDINVDGSLDCDDDLLATLDVVVASVHSKFQLPAGEQTRRLIRAVSSPHVDVLGHCTNRIIVGRGRRPSEFDARAVFEACAEHHTAVEINSRPERLDPPLELIQVALEAGCLFAVNSDAHAPGQLEWLAHGSRQAAHGGVPIDRIINTRPVDRLLAA
jgi:putative hydrolase